MWPTFELHLLHCPLIHLDGLVNVSSQQVNLAEHHEGLVVFIYLESHVQVLFGLTENRSESSDRHSKMRVA